MSSANLDPELIAIDAQLATVENELYILASILASKKELYRTLSTRRKQLVSTTPPVDPRDFPAEIVCRILEILILSIVDRLQRETELNRLRLVCTKWNRIILQNPALWRDITLVLDEEDQWIRAVERAKTNLHNHESLLVDVEVHASDLLPLDVVSFLKMHSPRISSLTLYLVWCATDVLPQLEGIIERNDVGWADGTWESLESVRILWCGDSPQTKFDPENYPALRNVEFGEHCTGLCSDPDAGDPTLRTLTRWDVPWVQLTSVTFSSLHDMLYQQLQVLTRCVNLSHLSLKVNISDAAQGGYSLWYDPPKEITFPLLRYLYLHTSIVCDMRGDFINLLILPSIESIAYTDESNHQDLRQASDRFFQSFSNLIERSSPCVLQSFTINFEQRTSSIDDEALINFLQVTPELKTLRVSAPNMTCDFLLYQDEEGANYMLPPSLEELHITALRPVNAHLVKKQFNEWITCCEEDDCLYLPTWKGGDGNRSRSIVKATLEIEEVATHEVSRSVPMWSDRYI